jgi:hypothetical protein
MDGIIEQYKKSYRSHTPRFNIAVDNFEYVGGEDTDQQREIFRSVDPSGKSSLLNPLSPHTAVAK